ncbi:MAG: hypothetical protein HY243_15220 [Proteobacteria bacterium]|nr:hypothetical protein [Pseudomonadota bacterium]
MWMLIAATLAAGTLMTFTDWLFFGVLFHKRYFIYPEVWRDRSGGKERSAILWSSVMDYFVAAAFIALCDLFHVTDLAPALLVAVLAWIAGPLIVTVTNSLFVKIDPLVTAAHATGYLARFVIAAVAAAVALPG